MRLGDRIRRIERATSLDRAAGLVRQAVRPLPKGRVRDVLHGVQLGHALHPMLVQLPIGAWLSASLLDTMPGNERASRRLVYIGLMAAAPAVVSGALDLSRQQQRHQRVGVVHAAANTAAWTLYGASSLARLRGRSGLGKVLGMAGMAAVGTGGMLGGHIAYSMAGGPAQSAQLPDRLPPGWQEIGLLHEFPEGQPVEALLGDVAVVVVRSGDTAHVLIDMCSHMAGPLSGGESDGQCLTCPWHGSTFRLSDGEVITGPATAPQPVLETHVEGGVLSARRPEGGISVPKQRESASREPTGSTLSP